MNPRQWWLLIGLDSLVVVGLIIFLGWRFDDFFGLVFSCGFNDFFMLEVSVEDKIGRASCRERV